MPRGYPLKAEFAVSEITGEQWTLRLPRVDSLVTFSVVLDVVADTRPNNASSREENLFLVLVPVIISGVMREID